MMRARHLAALAIVTTLAGRAGAQEHSDGDKGLTDAEEQAIEAEVRAEIELPELTAIDDPTQAARLWKIARRLTLRRAYCRATTYLDKVESLQGTITDNRAFSAQAFYMCARTRLYQGHVAESALMLQRAINIVPERPEYRDLQFKLAIVRAKDAVDRADLDAIERNMDEANKLGVAVGPGGGDRLADWAVPIVNEAAQKVAGWSRELLDAGNQEMADRASKLALEYYPHSRIAESVRREIVMYSVVLPVFLSTVGFLVVAAVGWGLLRRLRVRRAALDAEFGDDD